MPATEEGLRFLLLADVDDFVRAQKAAATAAENAAKGIVASGKMIAGSADYIKALQSQLKSFQNDFKNGQTRFVAYSAAVEKGGKETEKFAKRTAAAAGPLNSVNRIIQDYPFGFIAIQNNIAETVSQFGTFIQQQGGVGKALKATAASLLGTSGILIGINLLISYTTRLTQQYGSLGAAIDAILYPLNEQQKIQKEIAAATLKGAQNAQEELVKVNALYNATQNLNIPLAERNKLVDEIQSKYPSYFKNFSNEEILAGKAAQAYANLRTEILQAAQARAVEKAVADNISKLLELDLKRDELNKRITEAAVVAADRQAKAVNSLTSSYTQYGTTSNVAENAALGAARRVQSLTDQLKENGAETARVTALNDALLAKLNEIITASKGKALLDPGDKDSAQNVKTIQDVLAELQKQLAAIDASFKTVNFNFDDIQTQKIDALSNAFEDLIKLGLKPTSPEIQRITGQINLLNAAIEDITKRDALGKRLFDTKQLLQFNKQTITDPNGLKSERLVLRLPIDVDRNEVLKGAQGAAAKLQEGINFIQGNFVDTSDNLRKRLNETLTNSVVAGIGNIASAIGSALGTGQINGIFTAFANSIGSFLEEMGKILIANGVAIEAFKTSLESFQGAPAIIAGAALVIAGSAFRAFVAKGSDSFATGGTAWGPSTVTVGDNLDGYKEHILSDLQLQKLGRDAGMGAGGGNGFIAETRIELTQLVIGLRRAGVSISRIN